TIERHLAACAKIRNAPRTNHCPVEPSIGNAISAPEYRPRMIRPRRQVEAITEPKPVQSKRPKGHPKKLTVEQIADIRERYRKGEIQRVIAKSFAVGTMTVSRAIRGVR